MTIGYPSIEILMDFGAGLVSVADIFSTRLPISASWGNVDCVPSTRVALPGYINFTLNNSEYNSGAKMGYYSPGHTNLRSGFGLETPVVLKIGHGGNYKYKRYYISMITPSPGAFGDRQTDIQATDFMGRLLNQDVTGLAVQTSKRVDQGLATLVALMPTAPLATSYSVAPEVQAFLFHDITDNTPFLTAIHRLAMTDAGYIFVKGNASGGETLCYETRQERKLRSSGLTLSGTMRDIEVVIKENQIANDISVPIYPGVVGTADETMYKMPQEINLPPLGVKVIECNYTEPGAGSVGSTTVVVLNPGTGVTPVADTDFKASRISGSLSGDANASLQIVINWYANYAKVTLTNLSSLFDLFIMPFNLRGRIIRIYSALTARVQDTAGNYQKYGVRSLSYAMPYQSNLNFGNDMANHWFSLWHLPAALPQYVDFIGNYDTTFLAAVVALDIGSRITVAEALTSVNAEFSIMGVELIITDGSFLKVRYYLEPATLSPSCILDDAVYGVLDSANCRVGF